MIDPNTIPVLQIECETLLYTAATEIVGIYRICGIAQAITISIVTSSISSDSLISAEYNIIFEMNIHSLMQLQQAGVVISSMLQGETEEYSIDVEYEYNELAQTVFITCSNDEQTLCISIQQREEYMDISVRQFQGFNDTVTNQWLLRKLQNLNLTQQTIQTEIFKLIKILISFCFLRFNMTIPSSTITISVSQKLFLKYINEKIKYINIKQLKLDIDNALQEKQSQPADTRCEECEQSYPESIFTDFDRLGTHRDLNICQEQQQIQHYNVPLLSLQDLIQASSYLIKHMQANQFYPGLKQKYYNAIRQYIDELYIQESRQNSSMNADAYGDKYFSQEIKGILKTTQTLSQSLQQNYFRSQFMEIQLLFENQLKKTYKCKKILEKIKYYVLMIEVPGDLKGSAIQWYQKLQTNKDIKIAKIRYIWTEIKYNNTGPEIRQIYIQEEMFSETTLGYYIQHGFNLKLTDIDLINITRQLLVALSQLHEDYLYHGNITANSILIYNQDIVFRGLRYHANISLSSMHQQDLQQLSDIIKRLWENTVYFEEKYQIKQIIEDMNTQMSAQEIIEKHKNVLQYYDYSVIKTNADNLFKILITNTGSQQLSRSYQHSEHIDTTETIDVKDVLDQIYEHLKNNSEYIFQPFSKNIITLDKSTYRVLRDYIKFIESHLLIGYNQILQIRVNNLLMLNQLFDNVDKKSVYYITNDQIIFVGKIGNAIGCLKTIKWILKQVQYNTSVSSITATYPGEIIQNQQLQMQQINEIFSIQSHKVKENIKMEKIFKYQIIIKCQATLTVSVDQYQIYYQITVSLVQ